MSEDYLSHIMYSLQIVFSRFLDFYHICQLYCKYIHFVHANCKVAREIGPESGRYSQIRLYQRVLLYGFGHDVIYRISHFGSHSCTCKFDCSLVTGIACLQEIVRADMLKQQMEGLAVVMMAKMT
jgi:hypothetical protein